MAQFFLNLKQGGRTFVDNEGVDRPGPEDVRVIAVAAARDVMSEDILSGSLDLASCIEVCDTSGRVVLSVSFRDAISVSGLDGETQRRYGT